MDPEYVVFEVSSDEELGLGEKLGFDDIGGDDCDWIQELLKEVDRETEDANDSDDVVVVSEVAGNPKANLKNYNTGKVSDDDDDDDDDCVVLDGDPDKPETVDNNPTVDEDESDELQVVGETGQVACRDYPHPRHLCVKYPFTSTAHEIHCNQCHCYVCDSLAPCLHWAVNHCHATDKEEFWKNERKSLKKIQLVAVSVPQVSTSLSADAIQISQGPVSVPSEATYIPPNHVPAPVAVHACSRPSMYSIPTVEPRNRYRPNLVLQHLRDAGNDTLKRDKRLIAANAGLRVKSPPSVFKRTGPGSPLIPNRKYCLSNQTFKAQSMRRPPPMSMPIHNNSMRWQPLCPQMGSELNTYQRPSQPNMRANFSNSSAYQPRLSSTPNVMNPALNLAPCQPMISPHLNATNVLSSSVAYQPHVPSQPYSGNTFVRPFSAQPQFPFQPVAAYNYANNNCEPLIYGQSNASAAPNDYQRVEDVNQYPSFLDSTLPDIDTDWVDPATESNLHQQPPPFLHHQDKGLVSENATTLRLQTETDNLFSGNTNVEALNVQYDNWTLGSSDKPVHSPEPDISDSSFFFGL